MGQDAAIFYQGSAHFCTVWMYKHQLPPAITTAATDESLRCTDFLFMSLTVKLSLTDSKKVTITL